MSPLVNEQFDCRSLHKQDVGTKSRSGTSGIRPMGVVPSPQYPHRGSVFTRGTKYPSRLGISSIFRPSRLVTWPLVVCRAKPGLGPLRGRPVCLSALNSTYTVLQAVDSFSKDWSRVRGFVLPPFALVGCCLRQLLDQNVSHLVLVSPV